jgi:hypothetical protein
MSSVKKSEASPIESKCKSLKIVVFFCAANRLVGPAKPGGDISNNDKSLSKI